MTVTSERRRPFPRRWTLHGLNNGGIFEADLSRRSRPAAARLLRASAAWVRPSSRAPIRRAPTRSWTTFGPYFRARRDASSATGAEKSTAATRVTSSTSCDRWIVTSRGEELFEYESGASERVRAMHAKGRGVCSSAATTATGRPAACCWRAVRLPLTVVAMREASPTVNRIRQQVRSGSASRRSRSASRSTHH